MDPTLSMAVSLLQNAPHAHQEMAARYVLKNLDKNYTLNVHALSPSKLTFLFPSKKRTRLEPSAWKLLETMKQLPREQQLDISLTLINYIYLLDTGVTLDDMCGDDMLNADTLDTLSMGTKATTES